jgi:hypothetical protein
MPTHLVTLEQRLSTERLGPYRVACNDDLTAAVALYRWNAEVSAALGTTLGHLEVLLRNAMHRELTEWSTRQNSEARWYLDPGQVFTPEARRDIAKARERVTRNGREETPGRVVAELPFGFWRFLLATRYDGTLWRWCLHRPFGRRSRREIYGAVQELHGARNRMAHHEPMFNRRLEELRATVVQVAEWICPVTATWIAEGCRVQQVLADRPTTPSCVSIPSPVGRRPPVKVVGSRGQ